jgi:hypothetical protein
MDMRRIAILFALAGCGAHPKAPPTETTPPPSNTTPATPENGDIVASLSRGGCYGDCPIYTVTLHRDGTVDYDGEQYVKVTGKQTGHVDATAIEKLEAQFAKAGFADLKDAYSEEDCTDLPGATLTFHGKTVNHYFGDRSAPRVLFDLETAIDESAQSEQWVGDGQGGPYGSYCR